MLFRWVLIFISPESLPEAKADLVIYVVSWVSESKGLEGLRYISDGISD